MGEHTNMQPPSLWRQEPDEVTLLLLGKCAEECNELAARLCRSVIQGVNSVDPDTKRTNREELEREIADVEALVSLVCDHLKLSDNFIHERLNAKRRHKKTWLDSVSKAVEQENQVINNLIL